MTKMNPPLHWPEPIPGFDVLKWKQKTQARILHETAEMTREEVREYFRKGSEKFQKECAEYRAKHGLD